MSKSRRDDDDDLDEEEERPRKKKKKKSMTGKQAYNTVADTVGGANLRWRDNLFQAVGIGLCLLLGSLIGVIYVAASVPRSERTLEAFAAVCFCGGFVGLVLGFFITGLILMIYRAVRHARGEHD